MSDQSLEIKSHTGIYYTHFLEDALVQLNADIPYGAHFIIDAKVAELYGQEMGNILSARSALILDATELSKSLYNFPGYVERLVNQEIRRDHQLIGIGGGIIQDITCFLAATLLRGVGWQFYPTTLLSQADSCIGSKSSINCGDVKNILGTFTPPQQVFISTRFLGTLAQQELCSGVGEMLNAHAINGPESFNQIAADYEQLFCEPQVMISYIRRCLEIKKPFIEEDEFDRGPRNIFNYGHSFGHAIERATDFAVPHGIGVTIGMDLANRVAVELGLCTEDHFQAMHPTLRANYIEFVDQPVPLEPFLVALSKDIKNTGTANVSLILPNATGHVVKSTHANDDKLADICQTYFENGRTN